ncbi:CaiB/BaiF CoA transferase family protein [Inquilinus limosus]|uniref:Acyl-CoA transferase n=1 Tax=Inquilinus limosus MP06 TaxID=1398085 RepID=A0A0A0D8Z1_9PROT|nr:CoA transferase [Inquilinus limosus]KGM34525.1 acyl-CoA transferase [Inquilinus limosus MP06]
MTEQPIRFDPTLQGPLSGVRVLDLSRLVAGNMLSLQLADFGADVVKIEPPQGDPLRDWTDDGQSLHWKVYARNKRSMVLNLREAADMDALLALVETADVFIENFRPGTLESMGIAPERLLKLNPNLIVVRISGFGQTGPYAAYPGFGTLVEAMSGFAARTGFPDREPVLPPLALADMISGMTGAQAVTMALLAREKGLSRGQVIDLSLLEPIFAVLGPEAAIHRVTGKVKQRTGSASNTSSPRNVYRCGDGHYVALSGSMQVIAMRIFDIIGRPDMKTDPRFSSNAARVKHRDLVDQAVGAWFAERDRETALQVMRDAGATVGPVYDIADIAADPHFRERGVIVEVEDADNGSLPMHAVLPRLSGTPGGLRRPAPALGEHTEELKAEIARAAQTGKGDAP